MKKTVRKKSGSLLSLILILCMLLGSISDTDLFQAVNAAAAESISQDASADASGADAADDSEDVSGDVQSSDGTENDSDSSGAEEAISVGNAAVIETDENVLDAVLMDYIVSNIDEAYTSCDFFELVNVLIVKQTLAVSSELDGETTIDGMYDAGVAMDAIITAITTTTGVYDLSNDSDYVVSYANTMMDDGDYEATDAVFALYNYDGETVDGCVYDEETGLVYIPKDLYYNEDGEFEVGKLQVQFLQVSGIEDVTEMESEVGVVLETEEGEVETGSAAVSMFSFSTTADVGSGLDADRMIVAVNGVPTEDYTYDAQSGTLTVPYSSAGISSLSVKVEEETLIGKVLDLLSPITAVAATISYGSNTLETIADDPLVFSQEPDAGESWTTTMALYYGNHTEYYDTLTGGAYSGLSDTVDYYIVKYITSSTSYTKVKNYTLTTTANRTFLLTLPSSIDENSSGTAVSFGELAGEKMALFCAHVDSPLGVDNTGDTTVKMRILYVDEDTGVTIIGFVTSERYTQTGVGIAAFYYETEKTEAVTAYGKIDITKLAFDDGGDLVTDYETYSRIDATYTVYTDEDCTTTAKDINGDTVKLTTNTNYGNAAASAKIAVVDADVDGDYDEDDYEANTYYVKETKRPDSYYYDETVYEVNLLSGGVKSTSVKTVDNVEITTYVFKTVYVGGDDYGYADTLGHAYTADPLFEFAFTIEKEDSDSSSITDFSGTEYTIYGDYAETKSGNVKTDENGQPYLTDEVGVLSYDDDTGSFNTVTLGEGYYYMKETAASDNYAADEKVYRIRIKLTGYKDDDGNRYYSLAASIAYCSDVDGDEITWTRYTGSDLTLLSGAKYDQDDSSAVLLYYTVSENSSGDTVYYLYDIDSGSTTTTKLVTIGATVTMYDDSEVSVPLYVSIAKYDSSDSGITAFSGTSYGIYSSLAYDSDGVVKTDSNGQPKVKSKIDSFDYDDSSGSFNTVEISEDDQNEAQIYYIKETDATAGYEEDPTVYKVVFKITKKAADDGSAYYAFQAKVYYCYSVADDGEITWKAYSKSGNVSLIEKNSYDQDDSNYAVKLYFTASEDDDGNTVTKLYKDIHGSSATVSQLGVSIKLYDDSTPPDTEFTITKKDSSGLTGADFSGTEYTLYTALETDDDGDYETDEHGQPVPDTSSKAGVLTYDSSTGGFNTLTLSAGTYYIKETAAGDDYDIDTTVYRVIIKISTLSDDDGSAYYEYIAQIRYCYSVSGDSISWKQYSDGNLTLLSRSSYDSDSSAYRAVLDFTISEDSSGDMVYYVYGTSKEISSLGVSATFYDDSSSGSGYLTLTKASSNTGITGSNSLYNLKGAEYTVYMDAACTEVALDTDGDEAVLTVASSSGKTNTINIAPGTYYVKETAPPSNYSYLVDTAVHTVTVTSDNTEDNPATVALDDEPVTGTFKLKKYDSDRGSASSSSQGAASLEGAQYTVKFYTKQYSSASSVSSGYLAKTWVFETDENGAIDFSDSSYYVSGSSLYYDDDGNIVYPLGTYIITETKASAGYTADGETHIVNITAQYASGTVSAAVSVDGGSGSTVTVYSEEEAIRGGLTVKKYDADAGSGTPQGDATLEGAQFTIYNSTGGSVYVTNDYVESVTAGDWTITLADDANGDGWYENGEDIFVLTTDESGYASLDGNGDGQCYTLPCGTYTVKETKAPSGYLIGDGSGTLSDTKTIAADGTVYIVSAFEDEVIRGGISVRKYDSNSLQDGVSQGEADLDETVFYVYNSSEEAVYVTEDMIGSAYTGYVTLAGDSDHWYESGDLILTLTTGSTGFASTGNGLLPYGTYTVTEAEAPTGYLIGAYEDQDTENYTLSYDVVIAAESVYACGYTPDDGSYTGYVDDVIRGGLTIQKWDAEGDSSTPQGDATLEGAQFTIYNSTGNSVYVTSDYVESVTAGNWTITLKADDNSDGWYENGEDIFVLTTDENGYASLDGNQDGECYTLPYGTYTVKETKAPTGYLIGDGSGTLSYTKSVRTNETVYIVSTFEDYVERGGITVYKYDENREYDGDSDNASTPQGDATLEGAQFTIYNSSEESVYVTSDYVESVTAGDWTITLKADNNNDGWYEAGEDIFVLTTDENGYASLDGNGDGVCRTLPYGTYTVTETKAPTGYLIGDGSGLSFTRTIRADGSVYKAGYTNSSTTHTGYSDYVQRGGITVYKYDENREYDGDSDNASTPQGDATLEGAQFTIYNSSEESVYVTSDYVESVTAGDWTITLKADNNNDGWYEAGEDIFVLTTDENGCASLDGNGDGVCKTLPYGTYTVTETKAPTGYLIGDGSGLSFTRTVYAHGTVYKAGYTNSSTTHTGYFDYVKRGGITVYKYDSETGLNEEQGGADFVGTVLEIVNSSEEAVYVPESAVEESDYIIYDPEGAGQTENYSDEKAAEYSEDGWFLPGEAIMYIIVQDVDTDGDGEADACYATTDGNLDGECYTLPYGTYTVTEVDTVVEKGYYMGTDETNSSDLPTTAVLNDETDGTATFCDGQIVVCGQDHDNDGIYDKVLRGGFSFTKINTEGNALENVLFRIDSVDKNGEIQESHYFVTDSNGQFTTSWSYASHLTATANGNDEAGYAIDSGDYDSEEELAALEAQLSSACNIWFSEAAEVNTGEGCLPFGTYIITEIRTSANEGYDLLQWTVDVNQADGTHGDGTYDVYETGSVNDEESGIDYAVKPETEFITSTRTDPDEGSDATLDTKAAAVADDDESQFASATEGVYLKDTLSFANIDDDDYYKVVVTLMDRETKKAYTDQSGNTYSKTITIQDESGSFTKTVKFTDVDLTGAEGKELVFFAYVYDMNNYGAEYNSLTNWYDRDETIYVAEITTEALDSETGLHVADSRDSITITDTVSYSNLPYGSSYTLVGILYNGDTGEPLLDDDGNYIVARTDFKTNAAGGAALTYDDDYDALVASGTASLTFTVDSEDLDGATLVACEYLYSKLTSYQSKSEYQTLAELIVENGADSVSDIVAYEEDLANEDQTIHIPAMSTAASDTATLDSVGVAATETGITDTVSYENVVAGYTYKLEATVVDCGSGEALEYTGSAEFTPARSYGTASVTIDGISAEQDDTYVVYMILYVLGTDDEWHVVCNHEYIDDESETIHYPDVQTKAFDINTGDDVGTVESSATVVDTVLFSNVVPGTEYTVTGSLIDQETGETLPIGGATFTAATTFTVNVSYTCACGETFDSSDDAQAHLLEHYTEDEIAQLTEESDHYITDETAITVSDGESGTVTSVDDDGCAASGTVTVTFADIDSETLSGGSLVVYEVLSHNEIEAASHEEPLDEDQTVHYPDIDTEAYDYYTGDHTGTVWGRLINGIRSLLGFEDADADGIADAVQNNLIDSVSLENLVPGRTYTLTGTLYDYDTGEAYEQDGGKVTATATFTVSEDGTKLALESGAADSLTVDEYDETYNSVDATVKLAFSIDTSQTEGMTIVVYESLYHNDTEVVSHTDLDDEDQTVFYPQMQTHAADCETLDHVGTSSETATIIDEVKLTNLTVGKEYTVTGYPVYQEDYTDSDGVYHEADTAVEYDKDVSTDTVTFTADAAEMTVTLTYVIDSTLLEGTTAVVYEDLYYSGVLINSHHDISSEEQSVYYPKVGTNAADEDAADDVGAYTEEGTIVDTVTLTNLLAGNTYVLKGYLMDQNTGDYLTADGETFSREITIVVNEDGAITLSDDNETCEAASYDEDSGSADATVTMTFTGIDTTVLSDHTAVVFEYLYHEHEDCGDECWMTEEDDDSEEILAADHTELLDSAQSVHYPSVDTLAYDYYTGDHVGTVWGSLVNGIRTLLGYEDADQDGIADAVQKNLLDTVTLTNLVPGRTYTLYGILMDEDSGEEMTVNGETITKSYTFTVSVDGTGLAFTGDTPDEWEITETDADRNRISCTITMPFSIDTSQTAEWTATVYEYLYHNDVLAGEHTDIDDADQQASYIEVETHAVDAETLDHVGTSSETAAVIDAVSLQNLMIGQEYTVTGTLHYKEDFTDADGTAHSSGDEIAFDEDLSEYTVTVTADATEMTVTLTYVVDSTLLEGTTAVVFESVYHNGTEIIRHDDLESEEQSVCYPEIHTSAADDTTADDVGAYTADGSIIDTVSFTNLRAGMTYTVKGVLYSQETGTVLYADGEEVTAETTLTINEDGTASCSDGETIEITSYDSSNGTADGTVTVTFTGIDTTVLSDATVVVYERLYHTHEDCADCWMTETGGSSDDSDDASGDNEGILVADHTQLLDEQQSVHYPQIHTTAVDSETGTHAGSIWGVLVNGVKTLLGYADADGNGIDDSVQQSIVDTVELNNLVPGRIYTVTGVLYDQAAEEPLTINGEKITQSATFKVAEDGSGMELTSGEAENLVVTEYDADKNLANGTIDLVFIFDSSLLDNEPATIVVFEDLYHNAVLVAVHEDIEDEGQSVNEISVTSSAVDADTGDKVGKVSGQSSGATDNASGESSGDDSDDISSSTVSSIIDTVSMEKLVYGEEYTVVGYLIDQNESTTDNFVYLTDTDGTEITSSVTFTANGEDENFTLADSDEFSASGSVTLTFTFENELVQGKAITVVAEVYTENVLIAVHGYSLDEDGNFVIDADESVYYPTGKTNATDADTETHTGDSDTDTVITDLVYFQNLLVGEEYTITGTLYYQEDFTDADGAAHSAGDPVTTDGCAYTSSVAFAAASGIENAQDVTVTTLADGTQVVSGYIPITFTVDTSALAGATIVAFETFSHNGVTVFTHADIDDTPQMIKIPAISTNAHVEDLDEADVYNEDGSYATVVITDTVSYENLWTSEELAQMNKEGLAIKASSGTQVDDLKDGEVYGIEEEAVYTLVATLMVKETGEALTDSEGNVITVTKTFAVEAGEDGTVDAEFTLDLNDFLNEEGGCYLEGITLVAFETLYMGETPSDENKIGEHEDIDDYEQDIRFPEGRTHANDIVDSDTDDDCVESEEGHEHEVYATTDVQIIDKVSYGNLHGGTTYYISGTLVDKDTGEAVTDDNGDVITSTVVCDAEGNVLSTDGSFTTEGEYEDEADGYVYILFSFSGEALEGKTVVAFETVSREGRTVITHADLSDAAQTIHFPKIQTTAGYVCDGESLEDFHLALADDEITLYDVVAYENLKAGETYTITGILYDKETGEPLEIGGEIVTASQTFIVLNDGSSVSVGLGAEEAAADSSETAEAADDTETNEDYEGVSGTVELRFSMDASGLAGKTVVAFETLRAGGSEAGGKTLASHEDISDEAQSVHIPEIATAAADRNSGIRSGVVTDEAAVTDTVVYKNLIAGGTYTVKGTLINKMTGETVVDANGDEVTAQITFTAESGDGSCDLEFLFDASLLAGETITVFEELYDNDVLIGVHADLNDEEQTIYYPDIETKAYDKNTGTDIGTAVCETTVVDIVSYENLIPGTEYTVTGTLVSKSDGTILAEGCTTFTPEETSGTADVVFEIHSSELAGEDVVAFETLCYEGVALISHKDLTDEAQTVHFPAISTSAADGDSGTKSISYNASATITDTVTYRNLVPGTTYTLSGVLMDRETGTELIIDETMITAETEFTPEEPDGTVEVIFTLDSTGSGKNSIVVYETLLCEDVELVLHEDISDENQTVTVETVGTNVETGDRNIDPWIALAALAFCGMAFLGKKRRRQVKK